MDLSALSTLEFNKIRALLAEKVGSALGKELAEKLTPSSNFEEVERRLQETAEARMVLDSAINVPLGGIRDIRALLKRAEVGSILEPHELVAINSTLFAGRRLKTFFLEADIPLTILTAILIIVGIQLFMIGMQGDMMASMHREMMRELYRKKR